MRLCQLELMCWIPTNLSQSLFHPKKNMAMCQHRTILSNLTSCRYVRQWKVTHLKFPNENSQLEVLLPWELQMRGPSERAWTDTNMQYTAPKTVMTLQSDEKNIWKTKETHLHLMTRSWSVSSFSSICSLQSTVAILQPPCSPRSECHSLIRCEL